MLRPGSYLISGNLHDILIPFNSALAALQGLALHQEFHTPFGWVYSQLNYLGWLLIHSSTGIFSVNDLIVVTALMWSLLVLFLYLLFTICSPAHNAFSWKRLWLIGQFIVFVSFNFRGLSSLSFREVTWYGTYNNHLWALLFLQLVSLAVFVRFGLSRKILLQLIFLNGICAGLALNYKISFGLASIFFAAAALLINLPGWRWRFAYISSLVLLIFSLSFLLAPEHYSFGYYWQDLAYALQAKTEKKSRIDWLPLIIYFCIFIALLVRQQSLNLSVLISSLTNLKLRIDTLRIVMFSGVIATGMGLAIAGDYAQPNHYFAAAAAILILLGPSFTASERTQKFLELSSCVVLSLILLLHIQTDIRIAQYKNNALDSSRYLHVKFDTPYGKLDWTIDSFSSYDHLTQLTRLGTQPDLSEIIVDLAFPAYDGIRILTPVFLNADYVAGLVAAKKLTESVIGVHKLKVVMLEFANPMPLLLGSPIPPGSFHWMHLGTSISGQDTQNRIQSQWSSADLIILPAVAVDGVSQLILNCKFHSWNELNGKPFSAFATDRFHVYYRRSNLGKFLTEFQSPKITQRCQNLLEKYRLKIVKP